MKRETLVLTDLGGVCATSEDRLTTLVRLMVEKGVDTAQANRLARSIYPTVGETETHKQYISLELGTLDLKKVWRRVLKECSFDENAWPFDEFQIAHLATISLISPVIEVYARLAQQYGVRLGVVSDGDVYSWYVVQLAVRGEYQLKLDPVFVSSKYKTLKPELYKIVTDSHEVKPETDIVFIENRLDLAVPANNLGWSVILFDGLKQPASALEKTMHQLLKKKDLSPSIIVAGS